MDNIVSNTWQRVLIRNETVNVGGPEMGIKNKTDLYGNLNGGKWWLTKRMLCFRQKVYITSILS